MKTSKGINHDSMIIVELFEDISENEINDVVLSFK